jgi:hypothetical protein
VRETLKSFTIIIKSHIPSILYSLRVQIKMKVRPETDP